ncbi:MAG: hypothetical protein MRERC_1c169 [Mycoplasmataceae bacterium RC_NB112A]|nr:MAG: hypothetical protein MRERC_1c169 [Mycoplasmataceae bacterium RC_NB112A]
MLLKKEKEHKIIDLVEKKGFPELKEWLNSKDEEFKQNLIRNFEEKVPLFQRLLLEKMLAKLLPKLTKVLEKLKIEKLSESDCQITIELANNFFLKEMLSESNFKKLALIIKKGLARDQGVKEFLQGKVKFDFCWTSPSSYNSNYKYDGHYRCLPLNSDKLILDIVNAFEWETKEGKIIEYFSEEEIKKELSEEIYEFIKALPKIFHKVLTEKRINEIKNKLKEKQVETKELRDYFHLKVRNPDDDFVKWEEQMWSNNFPPSVAGDIASYSEVLEGIIDDISRRKEYIVKTLMPRLETERDLLTNEEIQLIKQEAKCIPVFTESWFLDSDSRLDSEHRIGRIIVQRKKFNEIIEEIDKGLDGLGDKELISLIRRLERIKSHAECPLQLTSGKTIEITNLKKLNQLIEKLENLVSEENMKRARETEEEAVIRELKEMGIRIGPKLNKESKRLLEEIHSNKKKTVTDYKIKKLQKNIKEAIIAWFKEKMEEKKVDKDKNLDRFKRLNASSQKIYSDKVANSSFGSGTKFEKIPKRAVEILKDIEKVSSSKK